MLLEHGLALQRQVVNYVAFYVDVVVQLCFFGYALSEHIIGPCLWRLGRGFFQWCNPAAPFAVTLVLSSIWGPVWPVPVANWQPHAFSINSPLI